MKLGQIKYEEGASIKLKALKARTGLTPNILSRIAFCMSVEDGTPFNPDAFPADSDRIIDRQVLLGPWDSLFVALMKERMHQDGEDPNDEELAGLLFRAHVHRGIHLLFKRVRDVSDLARVLPHSATTSGSYDETESDTEPIEATADV
jgi:DNA sulfur modification protein DndE